MEKQLEEMAPTTFKHQIAAIGPLPTDHALYGKSEEELAQVFHDDYIRALEESDKAGQYSLKAQLAYRQSSLKYQTIVNRLAEGLFV